MSILTRASASLWKKSRLFFTIVICSADLPLQLWSQGKPAAVQLVPVNVLSRDSSDHVDLFVHKGATAAAAPLRVLAVDAAGVRVTSYAASWATSDPAIATVALGTVQARAPGFALITVTVSGGLKASLVACVSDTGTAAVVAYFHQWPAVTVDPAHPETQPPIVMTPQESKPFVATDTAGPNTSGSGPAGNPLPASCLHWSTSSSALTVDRRGMVTNISSDTLTVAPFLRVQLGHP